METGRAGSGKTPTGSCRRLEAPRPPPYRETVAAKEPAPGSTQYSGGRRARHPAGSQQLDDGFDVGLERARPAERRKRGIHRYNFRSKRRPVSVPGVVALGSLVPEGKAGSLFEQSIDRGISIEVKKKRPTLSPTRWPRADTVMGQSSAGLCGRSRGCRGRLEHRLIFSWFANRLQFQKTTLALGLE